MLCDQCNIQNIIQDVSSRPERIRCYCTDFLPCENISVIIVTLCYFILCRARHKYRVCHVLFVKFVGNKISSFWIVIFVNAYLQTILDGPI